MIQKEVNFSSTEYVDIELEDVLNFIEEASTSDLQKISKAIQVDTPVNDRHANSLWDGFFQDLYIRIRKEFSTPFEAEEKLGL